MQTLSYTALRAHLAKTMQKVCEDHVPVIITRTKAQPVVLVSLEDYEALEETHYLLKSSTNASRLLESIDEIENLLAKNKEK